MPPKLAIRGCLGLRIMEAWQLLKQAYSRFQVCILIKICFHTLPGKFSSAKNKYSCSKNDAFRHGCLGRFTCSGPALPPVEPFRNRLGVFAATPTPWVRLRLLPNGKADYYGSNVIEQIATCTIICQKTSP